MSDPRPSPGDVESLTALAREFVQREMHDEAAELYEMALRLDPKDLSLKLSLAQLRQRRDRAREPAKPSREDELREQLRREAIDAGHFTGLAALYLSRGQLRQALECLEPIAQPSSVDARSHKVRGELLFRRQELEAAAQALAAARRFDPFDSDAADMASRALYELGRYRESLEAAIDSSLLLADGPRAQTAVQQRRLRRLRLHLNLEREQMLELFRQRRERLQTAVDRLVWHRERMLREKPAEVETAAGSRYERRGTRIEVAARLRRLDLWANLDDEQVFLLARAARTEIHSSGSRIFGYQSEGADIYLLERGRIRVTRPTDYGVIDLGRLGPGDAFGEVNFLSRGTRSGDAVADGPCHLIRLDAGELEALIHDHPELGLQIYSSFWHELARKLRGTNQQLRTFFAADSTPENFLKLRRGLPGQAGVVDVASREKIQLFREQGLSGEELDTLTNFSQVKRFPEGAYLFNEGDSGSEMYVVLEGRVMISTFIPGGGEEALAILGRGEFFGEMSLVDGQPRSADAKAIGGPATVVVFGEDTLAEVMAMDPLPALSFMILLCGLLGRRLREIDEKVTLWRIVSGDPDQGELRLA